MKTLGIGVAALALLALSGCRVAPSGAPPDSAAAAVPVDALPLEPGYYVRTDETCADASSAGVHHAMNKTTTLLMRREFAGSDFEFTACDGYGGDAPRWFLSSTPGEEA